MSSSCFQNRFELSSATNAGNYVFANGPATLAADLGPDSASVTLTTTPMASGSNYFLVINHVRDHATAPNTIAANTTILVFAGPYTPLAIGNPPPVGTISSAPAATMSAAPATTSAAPATHANSLTRLATAISMSKCGCNR